MSSHRRIRMLLYEYLKDELSAPDRSTVESHLTSCRKCTNELDHMRATMEILGTSTPKPAGERSSRFWNDFASVVLQKAVAQRAARRNPFIGAVEWIEELFTLHARTSFAVAGGLAVLLLIFAVRVLRTPETDEAALRGPAHETPSGSSVQNVSSQAALSPERVSQYFRKSKTLLVGLANLRTDETGPLDFSKERRVSRDLIQEARYLRQQPIDPRSRRVMSEMERILIELSTIDEHKNVPDVEIIRSGIHRENLLFKIRMAEAMYDSANNLYALGH